MYTTAIYVGERLLQQESLLLPSVHETFCVHVSHISHAANIDLGQDDTGLVTARWILSNLRYSTAPCQLCMSCENARNPFVQDKWGSYNFTLPLLIQGYTLTTWEKTAKSVNKNILPMTLL